MSLLEKIIHDCRKYPLAFCKFISANDAGATGGHQSGFYIPLSSHEILFDTPGQKGENKDKYVKIFWQDTFETESRFIYYGQKTRNEYRITRFGRGFPFLQDEYVGDLFVLIKVSDDYYHAYVISTDEEIENFLALVGITANETNQLIKKSNTADEEPTFEMLFEQYITNLTVDFPDTAEVSRKARDFHSILNRKAQQDADKMLLSWLHTEFELFKAIEQKRYQNRISTPFSSVDELVECANTLLNRRKSRAGKSLEHHLSEMFQKRDLLFSSQAKTEGNKKPDFIFPSEESYHNPVFTDDKLIFLGAKTTCKDRWRQILNEADRIKTKHLFTLQQGISENQLDEMYKHDVVLVVPKPYKTSFSSKYRDKILSLESFIAFAKEKSSL
ncbi:type II restriction endonuclease [Brevibacillus nitrificans]|uniref:type II restriction endonuclease n=1 Tax=Brevibacillus nitrificans TaxID=651560 RepID=UPI0028592BB9|nr:type II restriction endonuclease [Brevibacillus nitrificans]MDR7316059.1 type II restriction enzyme [Brevibacillus nitrificans]